MCGIYGLVSLTEAPLARGDLLDRMGAVLRHRGPDDCGAFRSRHAAFGVQRLAIVDVRPQARQPFVTPDRTTVLACNGEIYNAAALRTRFSRYPFRSRCDVEALVPLLREQGEGGLDHADGMFGLALWRATDRSLVLARDRAGEKPLFYTHLDGEVWFASEIQALLIHPGNPPKLDGLALTQYLTLGYTLEPRSVFQRIHKVPAGTSLTFCGAAAPRRRPIGGPHVVVPVSPMGARARLRSLLEDAVTKQMRADVPVGVFTSGGVDSAIITAIAVRTATRKVHTFTAAFVDAHHDESAQARRLSRELGTEHIETRIGEGELETAFSALMKGMAEPLADPALLPTYLLARTARQHVGVALSGEGADELFGGYPTYLGHRAAAWYGTLPAAIRRAAGAAAARLASNHRPVAPSFLLQRFTAHAGEPWLDRHLAWFGTGLVGHLQPEALDAVKADLPVAECPNPVAAAMALDYRTYLREGLLVKLDRAPMLASLETRAPFLDPHVTAFAAGLAPGEAIRGWRTKHLLKDAAAGLVPGWVLRRRKRGLSVPIAGWLNRGLRAEVDRLLHPEKLRCTGVLRGLPIDQFIKEHRGGQANHARLLWPIVVLQAWLEHWAPGEIAR
ncbi:MAG: asparagine synthase (glutamine-hydrolyzing) [Gemmatimonadetes bacterium]|nr:asparagine synthase (glutamine-hydrolyzing) [Gemmatimonadota bacterium]